ncbi:MAG: tetratricopeptide repeat protein [Drouetiella hepatica Uher 2000/2452]|jgi:tetratricopeptide (TPR) repeat protein|uniref:Tetratricopeptide repeat protein n=1 Tax=Drouetiella hepatica Uher 2000/2452 TaxID=904376 RepID=A0A951QJ00_9CYAN|nr:tetratricopeptide repeat protein [Drouetiella hepatica Uher 2000/2452]
MIDQVAAAFDRQDYKTAAQLLKQLRQQSPDNVWVRLYIARLQEVSGKWEAATIAYRQLLQETTNPKVSAQAREGLQRIETEVKTQRQEAIAQATADPASAGVGFLVLEPIAAEAKAEAAQSFAQIMKLDAYMARMILPSRGWRLYRTGALGELGLYGQELQKANIPAFWVSLADIQKIRVFRVQYFQAASPQPTVLCKNETDQLGSLTFAWSEVANRVEGLLPIFEDVVDVGIRNKLTHREETQDYAQVVDLHLPQRNCILRFCDRAYQFQNGVVFDASQDGELSAIQATLRIRWNQLTDFLKERSTTMPIQSDFTPFAETALEHLDLVKDFPAHIDLFRKAPTHWDTAFQLYSGLVFERSL